MNIGLHTGAPTGAGSDNVMRPLGIAVRKLGHEVMLYGPGDAVKSTHDIFHAGHQHIPLSLSMTFMPTTVNVHHIAPGMEQNTLTKLEFLQPRCIVVSDRFYQQRLGQLGIYNVVQIPQIFDQTGLVRFDYPAEFTLGCLGTHYPGKRFEVIKEAAALAGVPLQYNVRHDPLETGSPEWLPDKTEFFKKISCYVVASFIDAGPLPPQEALLCGRPVISTVTGSMPDVLVPGYSGEFYDGSVEDLVRAIKKVKTYFNQYARADQWAQKVLPKHEDVARQYIRLWESALE